MTAPNVTLLPSLMVGSQITGLNAGLQPLVASTLAVPSYVLDTSESTNARYVIAGSLATVALGSVLAGCSEPTPAPIRNESALPANQGSCPPNSRDPFCQGYRASHQQMVDDRREGHHSDQMFTGLLIGVAVLFTALPTFFFARRRYKRIGAEQALKAQEKAPAPQETAVSAGEAQDSSKT